MTMFRIGEFRLTPLCDGFFRLDGGAMFGIVPKVFWDKRAKPDGFNRINLALRPLLIQCRDRNILVDTGLGDKYPEKELEIYDVRKTPGLVESLRNAGLGPDEIHCVILTHLHFDHCGGNTTGAGNRIVPTFPKARYIIQKGEWEAALNPNERTKGSYRSENLLPLEEHGLVELVEGDCEPVPGLRVVVTGGHTKWHQLVIIGPQAEGRAVADCAIYWADLMPTTAHIDLPFIMSYDLYPEETLSEKKELLERVVSEGWLCFWEHDPDIAAGFVRFDGKRYRVERAAEDCGL